MSVETDIHYFHEFQLHDGIFFLQFLNAFRKAAQGREAYLILSNHDDHPNQDSTLIKVLARFDMVLTTFFDFAGDEVMLSPYDNRP
jgi:hypothetical protein